MSNSSKRDKIIQELKLASQRKSKWDGITKYPNKDTYELSYEQERLWFLQAAEPDNPFYTIFDSYEIIGEIDLDIWERSIQILSDKHLAIKTRFILKDNMPNQIIDKNAKTPAYYVDYSSMKEEERKSRISEYINEYTHNNLSLFEDELAQFHLFKIEEKKYILLITIHHIISDGQSLGVLLADLVTIYQKVYEGRTDEIMKMQVQYVDYCTWQKKNYGEDLIKKELEFWKEKFQEIPPFLNLPEEKLRPDQQKYSGQTIRFTFDREQTERLRCVSKENDTTMFITLLSMFYVLLYKYTGQEDICVGVPITSRDDVELQNVVGFFINLLPFRANIDSTKTFLEFLKEVKQLSLNYYQYKNVPFERIVNSLEMKRSLNRNPLCQVVFQLQDRRNMHMNNMHFELNHIDMEEKYTRFDMEYYLFEYENSIECELTYSSEIYTREAMNNFVKHFLFLVDAISFEPERVITAYNLLSPEEEKTIINQWSQPNISVEMKETVYSMFNQAVAKYPQNTALTLGDRNITYNELDKITECYAAFLITKGIAQGDIVAVLSENSLDAILLIVSIMKAGAVFCPIDIKLPEDRVQFIIRDSNAKCIFVKDSLKVQYDIPTYSFSDLENVEKCSFSRNINVDDPFYIMYTSGTTGVPKGVVVSNRNVVRLVNKPNYMEILPSDRIFHYAPISFDASTFEIWGALLSGCTLVIPTKKHLSIEELSDIVIKTPITILMITVSLFNILVEEKPECITGLSYILTGGDVANLKCIKKAVSYLGSQGKLVHAYGPTENTTFTSCYVMNKHTNCEWGVVPIGKPISNTTVYVLDNEKRLVPPGVIGELYTGGDGVALKYLNHKDFTEERFVLDKFEKKDNTRMYRTGDYVRWLPDGNLQFIGRKDNQVKIRGFRVEINEIENIIKSNELVKDCIIRVIKKKDVKELLAYLVPKNNSHISLKKTSEFLQNFNELFEEIYTKAGDSIYNFNGWESTYTKAKIPEEEMKEWHKYTMETIHAIKGESILEIGCGSGLLLFQLVDECKSYLGTDYSLSTIENLRHSLNKRGDGCHINVMHKEACDFSNIADNQYDTIIMNSVIQYFPNLDYLLDVLDNCIRKIKKGGRIFMGDIRNYDLLKEFHASVVYFQRKNYENLNELINRLYQSCMNENELLLSPAFFLALKNRYPEISNIQIEWKRGKYLNEMTKYRYNVVLEINSKPIELPKMIPFNWENDKVDELERLSEVLDGENQWVNIKGIYNKRNQKDIDFLAAIADSTLHLKSIRQLEKYIDRRSDEGNLIDVEEIYSLAEEKGYSVKIFPSKQNARLYFDVVCFNDNDYKNKVLNYFDSIDEIQKVNSIYELSNNPVNHTISQELITNVKAFVKQKLPEYMQPSLYMLIDRVPVNNNGKIDNTKLISPVCSERDVDSFYQAPKTLNQTIIHQVWAEILGIDKISIKDDFFSIGGNSLLTTRLIAKVRSIFGLDIPISEFFETPTIEALCGFIEEKSRYMKKTSNKLDLSQEVKLDADIVAIGDGKRQENPQNVLLTGCTGFVGIHLLHELLLTTNCNVYCHLRARNFSEGQQRIYRTLKKYRLWNSTYIDRIIPVVGDLKKEKLGIGLELYDKLCESIDIIYHNGAFVNFLYPYEELKQVNVFGTQEIVRFAVTKKQKTIEYISTLAVFSADAYQNKVAYEDDILENYENLEDAYAQTKWVAEKIIMEAASRNIPTHIYRLGRITGSVFTGMCNLNDMFSKMVKSYIVLGKIPDLQTTVDMTPVDYVTKSIVHISMNKNIKKKAFHLFNVNSPTNRVLQQLFMEAGVQLELCTLQQWKISLESYLTKNPDETLYPLLAFYLNDDSFFKDIDMEIDEKNVKECLDGTGIRCYEIDKQLIKKYYNHMVEERFIYPI